MSSVKIERLNSGVTAGACIAEITAVPYYELLSENIETSIHINHTTFTQLIQDVYRRSRNNDLSLELLYISSKADNQVYDGQVRMFIVVKKVAQSEEECITDIESTMSEIVHILEEHLYDIRMLDTEEYDEIDARYSELINNRVLSIAKNEKIIESMLAESGILYYNDLLETSNEINNIGIANALARYPNVLVSIQITPTCYNQDELYAVQYINNVLLNYINQIKMLPGRSIDPNTQLVADAYDYYCKLGNETMLLFSAIVAAEQDSVNEIANRVMDVFEAGGKGNSSVLVTTDITAYLEGENLSVCNSSSILKEIIINEARAKAFWDNPYAPTAMKRLKFLSNSNELKNIFSLPIGEDGLVGLANRKNRTTREKLDKGVISNDSFNLGIMKDTLSERNVLAGINIDALSKHCLIVGMPGTGKTYFSIGLLLRLWKENGDRHIPFLVIEPTKTEYRVMVDEIPELQVFTPGKNNVSPFIINPFIPPKGVTVETYIPSLVSAFKASFSMPSPLSEIFLSAINDCYFEYGWKSNSTIDDSKVTKFGLHEFIRVFKNKVSKINYKGDVKANIESAGIVRLVSLIEQNSNIYDTVNTIPIEDLLSKPTVIELNAINNNEQKSLIMALLLIAIGTYTKNNVASDGKLKNVLMIDEAHVLLGRNNAAGDQYVDPRGTAIDEIEHFITEFRAFGTGVIIADQSPLSVGRQVVSNTNLKVMFRLVERDNKDAVATATNMDDTLYELLGKLKVGEALLHHGKLDRPIYIQTLNYRDDTNMRSFVPDNDIAKLNQYWKNNPELLIPFNECCYNVECNHSCDMEIRSTADYMAAKVYSLVEAQLIDRETILKQLVKLDPYIESIANGDSSIQLTNRLRNCVKIKFLRKVMLSSNVYFSNEDYIKIVKHPNFIKKLES